MSLQADVEAKEKLKYEQQRGNEEELRTWMSTILPNHAPTLTNFSLSLHETLKDGVILCELILSIISSKDENHEWSKIRKPRVHPPGQGGFKERENITTYINLCKKIGLGQSLCFETNDLYDAKGLSFVINNISLIHRISQGKFDPQSAPTPPTSPGISPRISSPSPHRKVGGGGSSPAPSPLRSHQKQEEGGSQI